MQNRYNSILGSLLGHVFADALGATFEGVPLEHLRQRFGGADEVYQTSLSRSELKYTDDGQMMLAVAEYLCERDTIEPNQLMRYFVRAYEAWRGYGRGKRVLIEAFRDQADYDFMAGHLFPGGSLGNGGAMRSSPIGLRFVFEFERIREQAKSSAWPTHRHELGIEAAQLLALATSLALTEDHISPQNLSSLLLPHCATIVFQKRIQLLATVESDSDLAQFGNGIEAHESVVTSLACFSLFPEDYEMAVSHAFWQGGDTDTIGAMTGALVGARIGPTFRTGLPMEKLEEGQPFYAYLEKLAGRLAERS